MPINPNIALGAQQQQPVNYLGQMGQVLALKAAAQEIEGSEGVRNALSGGAPEDPTSLLQYGKQGRATYESLLKGRKEQLESTVKKIGITSSAFKVIEENPTLETAQKVFTDLVNMGAMDKRAATDAFAKVTANPTPENIRSLARQGIEYGITAAERLTAQTRIQAAQIGAGPGHRQATLAEQKFEFEKANPGYEYKTLDNGNIVAVNKRTNEVSLLRGPGAVAPPPPSPAGPPPAAANMLITPGVTSPNVKALSQATPNQAGPTIANAIALAANAPLRAAPRPGYEYNAQGQQVPIMDPTKVASTVTDRFGNVSMLNAAGEVIKKVEGMGKPSPGVEKQQEKEIVAKEGKESVNRVLSTLYSEYSNLVKAGGITDTRKSVSDNIAARTGASAVGQMAGSYAGTEAQSFRDTIAQTRPLLLTAIMKATGLSATQLNSNVELQTYLKTATDDKVSIQSNVNAMNNISKMFGLGEKFEVPEIPKATTSKTTPSAPSSAVVTTPDGRTIVFPDANAAARFKKEAGIK